MGEEIVAKRTVKDSVFTHLFQDKQYILQLYRALHPEESEYVTEDMIEIVTLENVLTDNLYNDLGFMIGQHLVVLVEAQSTWTVNIIIRALMYLARTYQEYIGKEALNIYSSRTISLPKPELYVVYTGEKRVEKDVITLSEEFFGGERTDLEVCVRVLTDGRQGDIIYQYVTFTKVLDGQVREYGRTREAIARTIQICKDRNVLRQYLTEHEKEVQDIMISLFDNETILNAYTREKITQARAEEKCATARKMLQKGLSMELIVELVGLPLSEVKALKAEMAN